MKEGLKGTGEGEALIWASLHHQGQQLERRRQPRRRALVGTAWESEGVSPWRLPFSRWRRMQSYCLKMGRGGGGGKDAGFESQSKHGITDTGADERTWWTCWGHGGPGP